MLDSPEELSLSGAFSLFDFTINNKLNLFGRI
jgi:hypothetical protein